MPSPSSVVRPPAGPVRRSRLPTVRPAPAPLPPPDPPHRSGSAASPTSTSIGSYSATTATNSAISSVARPYGHHRIRQHAVGVTRRHPDPRISPIDRKSYAAPEVLAHRSAPARAGTLLSTGKTLWPGFAGRQTLCAFRFKHLRFSRHSVPSPPAPPTSQSPCSRASPSAAQRSRAFPGDPSRGPSIETRCWSQAARPPERRRGARRRAGENLRCLKPAGRKLRSPTKPNHHVFAGPPPSPSPKD